MAVINGPCSVVVLKIKDSVVAEPSSSINNFRKTFEAEDKNVYVITAREQVTVPAAIGDAWVALDTDIEVVLRT